MSKTIVINKCTECPHMVFDPQENHAHWGEYVCMHPVILDSKGGVVLEDINIDKEIPEWCPLEDSIAAR